MEIKTKFDLGQEVFFIVPKMNVPKEHYKIRRGKISCIYIKCILGLKHCSSEYKIMAKEGCYSYYYDSEIYLSKEEAEQKLKEVKDEQKRTSI